MVQFKNCRHQNWNEMGATYWEAKVVHGVFASTILRILWPDPLTDHIQSRCRKEGLGDGCNRDPLHPNGCRVVALSNCARTKNWITQPHTPTLASWNTFHAYGLPQWSFHRLLWRSSSWRASSEHFFSIRPHYWCLVQGWCKIGTIVQLRKGHNKWLE